MVTWMENGICAPVGFQAAGIHCGIRLSLIHIFYAVWQSQHNAHDTMESESVLHCTAFAGADNAAVGIFLWFLGMLCYSNIKEMMFMKHVRMMYLKGCPHCKAAFAMVKELQDSYPELRGVNIEAIEEQEQKKLADSLDYWYVPTYFVDGVKLLEGVPTKEKVEAVLRAAL